jgi:phosphoglycolate phosphatase
MIKAVVFDFDGTIADTQPMTLEAVRQIANQELGKKYTSKDLKRLKDMGIIEALRKERIPLLKIPYFIQEIKSRSEKKRAGAWLFPGMAPLLKKLSKTYRIGVLTSCSKNTVQAILKNRKVEGISFLSAGSPFFEKHLAIREMLRETHLRKDEVIYIGDEIRDIEACRKAGIRIISVTWGYNSRKRLHLEKPDFLVDKPEDIISVLSRLAQRPQRQ